MASYDRTSNRGFEAPENRASQPARTTWDHDIICKALRAPERDDRLAQIAPRLRHTFSWALENESIGLSRWLQQGDGIFWIRGKPASRKSTLRKYLYQDQQTTELLRAGNWGFKLVKASFFFHHRGTSVQKSFEGLLRSLVSQVIEQEHSLTQRLYPILEDRFRNGVESYLTANADHLIKRFPSVDVHGLIQKILSAIKSTEIADSPAALLNILSNFKASHEAEDSRKSHADQACVSISELLDQQKSSAETSVWDREELELALQNLTNQKQGKLSICIFLDALDEYDGRPELVASFIKRLVSFSGNPDTPSMTKLQILMSSRPLIEFTEEFGKGLGLQIQDYTTNDIRTVCAARIPQNQFALRLLEPLVSDIVDRAEGVFLWVTLVMRDLLAELHRVPQASFESLEQGLRNVLDTLPFELDEFYELIIKRIPKNRREDCYVIMESLSRARTNISTSSLIGILHTSASQTVQQATAAIEAECRTWQQQTTHIATATGGLVETVLSADPETFVVQFMHQTVKDFVESPRFKLLVLEPGLARLVHENGHTFLAKACLSLSLDFEEDLDWHAYHSERTTAHSLYNYFSTVNWGYKPYHHTLFNGPNMRVALGPAEHLGIRFRDLATTLEFAIASGLQLCVTDCFDAEPHCLPRGPPSKGKPDFVSLLVLSLYSTRAMATSLESGRIAKYLLEHGMQVQDNTKGIWHLIFQLGNWEIGQAVETSRMLSVQRLAHELTEVWPVTRTTSSSHTKNEFSDDGFQSKVQVSELGFHTDREVATTSLVLINDLLRRGFDPSALVNVPYMRGNLRKLSIMPKLKHMDDFVEATLIDIFVDRFLHRYYNLLPSTEPPAKLPRIHVEPGHMYTFKVICLLVQYGGRLHHCSRSRWNSYYRAICEGEGISQPEVLRRHGFPRWTSIGLRNSDQHVQLTAWSRDYIRARSRRLLSII